MTCKSFFALIAAGMLAVSCTSNDEPQINEPAPDAPGVTDGNAFVRMAINLPSTRANGGRSLNDVFEDGLPSEYAVYSAHLVTFTGTTEADATVAEVVTLQDFKPWNNVGTSTDQVTTEATIVQEITKLPAETGKLFALIVLNDNKAAEHFTVGATLNGLNTKAIESMVGENGGFIMMNAPLSFGGTAKTLVEIKRDNIFPSKAEAATNPALEVFVERGVAKLTVQNAMTDNTVENATATGNPVNVNITAWGLDMSNKSTYLVRNVNGFDTWKGYDNGNGTRFFGTAAVSTGDYANATRIYWAKDPNYDTAINPADVPTHFNRTDMAGVANDFDAIEYPLENTSDVARMNATNMSRVLFKGQIEIDGTVATVYQIGSATKVYDEANLKNVIINALSTALGRTDVSPAATLSVSATAGEHVLTADDFTYQEGAARLTATQLEALNNAIGKINTFLNGECYYAVPVKHFGDDLTPWNAGDPNYGEEPQASVKYLGRYGMVRNNWYELSVNSVKTLGTSTVTDPGDTPVDENHSYISVTCKIFSWAKRNQVVDL